MTRQLIIFLLTIAVVNATCKTTSWSTWSPCRLDERRFRSRIDTCNNHQLSYEACSAPYACSFLTAAYDGRSNASQGFSVHKEDSSFIEEIFAAVYHNGTHFKSMFSVLSDVPLPEGVEYHGATLVATTFEACRGDILETKQTTMSLLNMASGYQLIFPLTSSCSNISVSLQITVVHSVRAEPFLLALNMTTSANDFCNVLDTRACCDGCETGEWSLWGSCRPDGKRVRTRKDSCENNQVQYELCAALEYCAAEIAIYNGTNIPPQISGFSIASGASESFTEDVLLSATINNKELQFIIFILADTPLDINVETRLFFHVVDSCSEQQPDSPTVLTFPASLLNDPDGATLVYPASIDVCGDMSMIIQLELVHSVNGTETSLLLDMVSADTPRCLTLDTRTCCDCSRTEWSPWSPCRPDGRRTRTRLDNCTNDQVEDEECDALATCGFLSARYVGTTPPRIDGMEIFVSPSGLPGSFTEELLIIASVQGNQLQVALHILADEPLGQNVTYDGASFVMQVFSNCTSSEVLESMQQNDIPLNAPNGSTFTFATQLDPCENVAFSIQTTIRHKVNGTTHLFIALFETGPFISCNIINTQSCCGCSQTEWSSWSPCRRDGHRVRTRFDDCTNNQVEYEECDVDEVCAALTGSYRGTNPPQIANFSVATAIPLPGNFTEDVFASVLFNDTHLTATVILLSEEHTNITKIARIQLITLNDCNAAEVMGTVEGVALLNDANGSSLVFPGDSAPTFKPCNGVSFGLTIMLLHSDGGGHEQMSLHLNIPTNNTSYCNTLDTGACVEDEWSPWSLCRQDRQRLRTRTSSCSGLVQYEDCQPSKACDFAIAIYDGATPPTINNFEVVFPSATTLPASFSEQIYVEVIFSEAQLRANLFVLSNLSLAPGIVYNSSAVTLAASSNCELDSSATVSGQALNSQEGLTVSHPQLFDPCDDVLFSLEVVTTHMVNGTQTQFVALVNSSTVSSETWLCNALDTQCCCEEERHCVQTWGFWKNSDINRCDDPLLCSSSVEYWFQREPSSDNIFVLLAHQYLAAYFNVNCSGAEPNDDELALIATASAYLDLRCDKNLTPNKDKEGISLAIKLTRFNEGELSVEACKQGGCGDSCRHDDSLDWTHLLNMRSTNTEIKVYSSWMYILAVSGVLVIIGSVVIGVFIRGRKHEPTESTEPLIAENTERDV